MLSFFLILGSWNLLINILHTFFGRINQKARMILKRCLNTTMIISLILSIWRFSWLGAITFVGLYVPILWICVKLHDKWLPKSAWYRKKKEEYYDKIAAQYSTDYEQNREHYDRLSAQLSQKFERN